MKRSSAANFVGYQAKDDGAKESRHADSVEENGDIELAVTDQVEFRDQIALFVWEPVLPAIGARLCALPVMHRIDVDIALVKFPQSRVGTT